MKHLRHFKIIRMSKNTCNTPSLTKFKFSFQFTFTQKCSDHLRTNMFRSPTHKKCSDHYTQKWSPHLIRSVKITYTQTFSDRLHIEKFISPTLLNIQITYTRKCSYDLHREMFRWPTHRSVMWFWFTQLGIFADAVSCCAVMRFYLLICQITYGNIFLQWKRSFTTQNNQKYKYLKPVVLFQWSDPNSIHIP